MSDEQLQPGWYDREDGTRHYWDGTSWLTPTSVADIPPRSETTIEVRPRRRLWLRFGAVAGVVVIVVGGYLAYGQVTQRNEANTAQAATARAEASASAQASRAAVDLKARQEAAASQLAAQLEADRQAATSFDALMTAQTADAWQVIQSGALYFRYAHANEYTCGRWSCLGVVAFSHTGCPGGVYVEASITRSGVVVGRTNVVIGGLTPDQTGSAVLQDTSGAGDAFQVTKVNCWP